MQPFNYTDAVNLQSALDLAAAEGAMLIAGGTDMLQLLQEDVVAPIPTSACGAMATNFSKTVKSTESNGSFRRVNGSMRSRMPFPTFAKPVVRRLHLC